MIWHQEVIQGEFLIERWDTRLPTIGMLRVEREVGRKLGDRAVWRVVSYTLGIRHDIVAETLADAQTQAIAFVRAALVEALDALSVV